MEMQVELSFLPVKDKIVAAVGLHLVSFSTQELLPLVPAITSVERQLLQTWPVMVKAVKEEIAVELVKEGEMIVIVDRTQQVRLLPLFYPSSLANKHSILHSYKHGPPLQLTAWVSQAHTLQIVVCLLQDIILFLHNKKPSPEDNSLRSTPLSITLKSIILTLTSPRLVSPLFNNWQSLRVTPTIRNLKCSGLTFGSFLYGLIMNLGEHLITKMLSHEIL